MSKLNLIANRIDQPIGDFSGLRFSSTPITQFAPDSVSEVVHLLNYARINNTSIRTRAQGHSLNGSSLPGQNELLVVTHKLQTVRFDEPGTVTVGSGVVLWTLRDILLKTGFDLPMLNDGYPGPTVGGYISAGGIGPGSVKHGGFWNNVLSVTCVAGNGEIQTVDRENPLFPWLFGAMGQLGFIVEAKLRIIDSASASQPRYACGHEVVAPFLNKPVVPPEFQLQENQGLFWFTLVCPTAVVDDAHIALKKLEQDFTGVLQFQERYNYSIRYFDPGTPPLFHSHSGDLIATGAWGWLMDTTADGTDKLRQFDQRFGELALSEPHYSRYIQSELPNSHRAYQNCFGTATYEKFLHLKHQQDPMHLLNRGSVFSTPLR